MRSLYNLLLYLVLPLFVVRLYWKSLRNPGYRERLGERFGYIKPLHKAHGSIWIHAVSVGEVQATEPLVQWLKQAYPQLPIIMTTTTPTGSERVAKLFGESVLHSYFPYDVPFALGRFLDRARPLMLIMIETEIWPNLIRSCHERGIATLLANARLSEKSALGYSRLGRFTEEVFGQIGLVAAQAPVDAERFLGLGVSRDHVRVTGSIKFDIRLSASLHEQADHLRHSLGHRPVWVAASTHEGEEELLLRAHQRVLEHYPEALLILVPRHPERFDRVHSLCTQSGLNVSRRSLGEACAARDALLLGDTMGEVVLFYASADIAFVGGSLVPRGGHNILEPAALGLPILYGPHMFNFAVISHLLLAEDAAVQVADEVELTDSILNWLGDASERTRIGENARRVMDANSGALERLTALIDLLLQDGHLQSGS